MIKRSILSPVFIVLILSVIVSSALAMPDPFSTLLVWPIGTPEEAEGPIVTGSPAELIIYNKDNSHVLDDVWLLLVTNFNLDAYLVSISTNTSLIFLPEHFKEIPGTASPSDRIPPTGSDTGTTPTPPYAYRPNGWPGIEYNDQYDVGSLRSNLDIASGDSMWYSVGDLDSSTDWVDHGPEGLNKQDPEYFTLTIELQSGAPDNWKVLVLALGHTDNYPDNSILNVQSPYTRSTLVVVPELGTILLALAPLSAFGLYKIRHKIRKKQTQES